MSSLQGWHVSRKYIKMTKHMEYNILLLYKSILLILLIVIIMLMFNRKNIIIATWASWTSLGFKRGMDDYTYSYEKQKTKGKNIEYMYSEQITYGLIGSFIYVNPVLLVITIPKEIYRLEVNIRDLKNEKESNYYNELL